jgi:hypothetical protein
MSHEWHYRLDTLIGMSETVGPIAESDLITLLQRATVSRETLVASSTRTNGQWYHFKQLATLLEVFEKAEADRREAKERQASEKAEAATAAAVEVDAKRVRDAAVLEEARKRVAEVSDHTDPDFVSSILQRVSGLLTSGEQVQYIVVQRKPPINVTPDAIVATSRRLISIGQKCSDAMSYSIQSERNSTTNC